MGAWKRLNQQDAYVTTYAARKFHRLIELNSDPQGINIFQATGSFDNYYLDSNDLSDCFITGSPEDREYKPLVKRSIRHLYYSNYDLDSGSIETSGSFENYEQSSFIFYRSSNESNELYKKVFNRDTEATVISIPRRLYGSHIEPFSFTLDPGSLPFRSLFDDGQGFLRTLTTRDEGEIKGIINYTHGICVISASVDTYAPTTANSLPSNYEISFKGNHEVYTYNYNIKLSDYEFNHTLNPTAQSGSDGKAADLATGSYFQPYITSVGLYNDANELIAVAKLSKPLPKSRHTETVIKVRLDM